MSITGMVSFLTSADQSYGLRMYAPIWSSSFGKSSGCGAIATYDLYIGVSFICAAMAEQMKETPMYKSYVAIAPHPEDFPKLLDQMGAYMRKAYDWSADVKKLTMPVMLIYGDSDMFQPEHIVKFYQLLGGGLKDAGWQREHMTQNRLA